MVEMPLFKNLYKDTKHVVSCKYSLQEHSLKVSVCNCIVKQTETDITMYSSIALCLNAILC